MAALGGFSDKMGLLKMFHIPCFRKNALLLDGFRQSVGSLLLCTLSINILSLALPIMTLQVYDRILPNPGSGTLSVLVMGVCLAVMLEVSLRLCRSYVIGRSAAAYEHRMACKAMDKILSADLSKIGNYGIGEHLQRMASVGKLKDFYSGYALTTIAELIFVPLFFMLIYYIASELVFVPVLILSVFLVVSFWRGYRLRHALKQRENADDKRFNFLIEALEGVHTLKAFALENIFQRRYEALEEYSTLQNYNVTQETASTFNMGAVFSHLMVVSVITVGAIFVLNGMLTTGALIATLLLSGRMMQPIQKALGLWARYQDYKLARSNIEGLFNTPQHITSNILSPNTVSDGNLDIENLSFQYLGDEAPILNDINLSIKRGDTVLISGNHGSGKTTLLNLIAGIYPPSAGNILIDNEDIRNYPPEVLARHVGYIRSSALIFRGTIRDNITCFGQVSETKAKEVSALLNVDKDVAKLAGGFDTFLSADSADNIPPGLKQRIAIVRSLAAKSRLILFDNADRLLDKEGYATMYSLLARLKGKVAMVLVTEDYNIQGLAERRYVIENNTLSKVGDIEHAGNIRPYKELHI